MDAFSFFYQFLTSFSFLVLATAGLSIIFGVMNVINFAHASFIMLGAVFTVSLVNHFGFPLFAAVAAATVGVALLGVAIEQLVIRRLYNRILDCLLATWAINVILVQGVFIWLGSTQKGVGVPFDSFSVAGLSYSMYSVFVAAFSVVVIAFIYWLFRHTDFGMRVRASMEDKDMAAALGTNTAMIYLVTFGFGAGFAGLAGALYAPLMPVSPFFGDKFLWRAFTVVIVGGSDPLLGPLMSSGALGLVYSGLTSFWGTVAGSIGMLVVTMLFIRLFPSGFTGLVEWWAARKGRSE